MNEITLLLAFGAGVISFLSPCVLPILPGFLAYLGGIGGSGVASRRAIFAASLLFVLGFSSVFSLLGIIVSTVAGSAAEDVRLWLGRIGGTLIIMFGLYLLGLLKLPWLESQHTFSVRRQYFSREVTSFLFGAAFAAGWTPCVGAVLGGIFGLALSQPGLAFPLLFAYSFGLGLPFLLIGAGTAQVVVYLNRALPFMGYVNKVFGAGLIVVGILAFVGQLSRLADFRLVTQLFFGS
jgi:cytochrome c-type biogenesis protein